MAICTGPNGIPLPRSLATARAVRRELIALYRQTKGGVIDPQVAGRLTHQLSVLVGVMREHVFEERMAEVERRLGIGPPRPNGHDRRPEARP